MTTTVIAMILAIGGLLPVLIAAVTRATWSSKVKVAASVGIAILAGLINWVTQNGLNSFNVHDGSTLFITIGGIIILSATAYTAIWKPSGVTSKITDKTNPTVPTDGGSVSTDVNPGA